MSGEEPEGDEKEKGGARIRKHLPPRCVIERQASVRFLLPPKGVMTQVPWAVCA